MALTPAERGELFKMADGDDNIREVIESLITIVDCQLKNSRGSEYEKYDRLIRSLVEVRVLMEFYGGENADH